MAKKIALLVAGAAVQKYMVKLADEQEILGLISDIIIEVFPMESALLRAMKSMEKAGDEKAQLQKAIVKVYVNDGFNRVEGFARQALSAIAEGDTLRTLLSGLKKLTKFTPVNTVAFGGEVGDYTIKIGRYPF